MTNHILLAVVILTQKSVYPFVRLESPAPQTKKKSEPVIGGELSLLPSPRHDSVQGIVKSRVLEGERCNCIRRNQIHDDHMHLGKLFPNKSN